MTDEEAKAIKEIAHQLALSKSKFKTFKFHVDKSLKELSGVEWQQKQADADWEKDRPADSHWNTDVKEE